MISGGIEVRSNLRNIESDLLQQSDLFKAKAAIVP